MTTPVSTPVDSRKGYTLRLDDAAIDTIVQLYPEKVREPVKWLASYVRERCNRNLRVLEKHVADLKFDTKYSTFFKIFTARYFVIADKGKQKGKLIGSVDNFLQIVDALRRNFRIAERAGKVPFIETPDTWCVIRDYIDGRRAADSVCKFGVIIGPTGAQKTACLKEYCSRNNHGTCVHIEAPHTCSMTTFITDLAARYGCSIWSNQENKLRTIYGSVNSTRTVVIDNVQRLYNPKSAGNQPIFNFLQKLQDDTDCTVILSFTPEFEKILTDGINAGYFEQFEGRVGGRGEFLRLPIHATRDDVSAIAASFGLSPDDRALRMLEKIAAEPGRIRILFNTLQKAKRLADAEGAELTVEHVRDVRGENEEDK